MLYTTLHLCPGCSSFIFSLQSKKQCFPKIIPLTGCDCKCTRQKAKHTTDMASVTSAVIS